MGKKWCLHLFSVAFDPILFILAGKKDMHKISEEFKFWPDRTTDYGVSCWVSKKFPIRLIMGKCYLHASLFIFYRISIKVAGNQDRHKSLVEFDFGSNHTAHFGVTCPWVTKISHFWTWISLKTVGQSWSNFMCSIIRVGKRLHKVFGHIGLLKLAIVALWATCWVICPWSVCVSVRCQLVKLCVRPWSLNSRSVFMKFCVHIDIGEIAKCHLSLVEALPRSRWSKLCRDPNCEKVKLTLEPWDYFDKSLVYTLILTSSRPWYFQISFLVGRGFAEVKILKQWNWPYLLKHGIIFW